MGKNSKPWLNYKSHEDINEHKLTKLIRTERKYKVALFYLIFSGFAGGHLFYLYDEKRAWKVCGLYVVIVIAASFLKPFLVAAPYIAVIFYAFGVIFATYPNLKADVERVNREIEND